MKRFLIILLVLLSCFCASCKTPPPPNDVDLNAIGIRIDAEFILTNEDDFDWTNVRIELNKTDLSKKESSGYIYKVAKIKSGSTCFLSLMSFTRSDGRRFNPYTTELINIYIQCDTPDGQGSYYGIWE